jgi:acyl-CoA thioesterase YciA
MSDRQPKGELVIRVCAMPKDVNANGDIFGGWLLSHLDLAGAALAQEISRCRVTTVAVDSMSFKAPIHVGEYVCFYAENLGIGHTSVRIGIEAWAINLTQESTAKHLVSAAVFTYVALSKNGKPQAISDHKKNTPENK